MRTETSALEAAFSPETFRSQGHALVDRLADHLKAALAREMPQTQPWKEPEANLADWPADFSEGPGADFLPFVESFLRDSIRLHHPRYMGHQVSAPLPMAALLDFAAALLNNSMAVYEMGPAGTALEINVVKWMGKKLGLGENCGGILTSGGTLGTLTALLAARQAKSGFDAWNEGVGAKNLAVIASEQCHYCATRAVKVMGLGSGGFVAAATDGRFRMTRDSLKDALARAKAEGKTAFAVVASACSTSTGSFDPIDEIADVCRDEGLWLHVDGAHGAAAILSEKHRSLLEGVERADSVVWDAHKMSMMPSLITAVIFKNDADSYKAFAQQAPYLLSAYEPQANANKRESHTSTKRELRTNFDKTAKAGRFNQAERSYECTKRSMSLKLYGSLKLLGTRVFSDHIDATFDLARSFASMIRDSSDFELAVAPQANIVCFRHVPEGNSDHDALNATIRRRLLEDGRFYIVQTKLQSGLYLRVTFMNAFTTTADLEELLETIRSLGGIER